MTHLLHCIVEILALRHCTAQNALKNGLKKQSDSENYQMSSNNLFIDESD